MSVRYLFNTSGIYVAFVSGSRVYTPTCEWIGDIVLGNQMYDTHGAFVGYVLDDDRVAKNTLEPRKPRRPRSLRPMRPMRPMRPLKRLRMLPLPAPYKDVFSDVVPSGKLSTSIAARQSFVDFLDSKLIAGDGIFLGAVNTNRFDPDSLVNQFGTYGSAYNLSSVFNQYGAYGGPYGAFSPFNVNGKPASVVKNVRIVGLLSKNERIENRTDPDEFFAWLKSL